MHKSFMASVDALVETALNEDAYQDDVTTQALIASTHKAEARIVAKEKGVIAGVFLARRVFEKIEKRFRFQALVKEGQAVVPGKVIAKLQGKARSILIGERTALNFISHLSGIASYTRRCVKALGGKKIALLNTRKTTPGLRFLELYAVRVAGGENHRAHLGEMVLIKDNHRALMRHQFTIQQMMEKARRQSDKLIEIEIDRLRDLPETVAARPDIILLDNMSVAQLKKAVRMLSVMSKESLQRPLLEASGGITLKSLRRIAQTGVDRISMGALTRRHNGLDVSLEVTE